MSKSRAEEEPESPWSGGAATLKPEVPVATGGDGGRGRQDRAPVVGEALGGAARHSRVSGALAAPRTRRCAGPSAGGGAPDQWGGRGGVGRQSADGTAATVQHYRVGPDLGGRRGLGDPASGPER